MVRARAVRSRSRKPVVEPSAPLRAGRSSRNLGRSASSAPPAASTAKTGSGPDEATAKAAVGEPSLPAGSRTIRLEDRGQDFTYWTIDRDGVVVDCGPFQGWLWNGTRILNRNIRRGDILTILPKGAAEPTTLLYPVVSIDRVGRA